MQGHFKRIIVPGEVRGAAAHLVVLFQYQHLQSTGRQVRTGREASHAGADDDYVVFRLVSGWSYFPAA